MEFSKEFRKFNTDFGEMKYLVLSEEKEEYAVILQGWGTESDLYKDIVNELCKKYRVIFPLFQGFSESAEPCKPMAVSDYAECVLELLRELKIEKAHFFCHSYGGRVFFKLNADKDFQTEVQSVILCDVAGIVPKKTIKAKISLKAYKFSRWFLELKPINYFFPDALDSLRKKRGSADYNSASPVMKETLKLSVNEDLRELFGFVDCPCLIMWGKNDSAVPISDAYLIEKSIKDSAVIEFENSDHFPFLTEKPRFLRVMNSFFGI